MHQFAYPPLEAPLEASIDSKKRMDPPSVASPRLSVIIPTFNEAACLGATLQALFAGAISQAEIPDPTRLNGTAVGLDPAQPPGIEVIIADGGSQDGTEAVVQAYLQAHYPVRWLSIPGGRAAQQNAAAAVAQADRLLFLHGDTQVAPGYLPLIEYILARPGVVAGAFELAIAGDHPQLRWVERGVSWRSHRWQLPYGDQGLFLTQAQFRALGGFARQPILEDLDLVQRLRRLGQIAIAPSAVQTSARRWESLGVLRTTLINQTMLLGYGLKLPPAWLARWYRSQKAKAQNAKPPQLRIQQKQA